MTELARAGWSRGWRSEGSRSTSSRARVVLRAPVPVPSLQAEALLCSNRKKKKMVIL
jgi:hypothetical protein